MLEDNEPTRKSGLSGISAIVLAAGMSQRMGSPKQLLRLGGSTLLEHALSNVRQANVDQVILVLGFAAEEIQRKISTNGFRVVINPNYRQGMGTSLRMGLVAIDPQGIGALIILADQPFVRPETLNRMIDYHGQHRPQIIVPIYKGFRGNPILLDRSVFPELMNLQGDVGCRAIFGSHTENIHKLPVEDVGILVDVDTSQDMQKLAEEGPAALLPKTDLEERVIPALPKHPSQPELVIVGNDAVAAALVRLGCVLGFTTTLVDPFLKPADFPEADRILHCLDFSLLPKNEACYIVVASRGQFDEEALEQALAGDAPYIGLMAGKSRRDELMRILKQKGIPEASLSKLRAPAGLEIGAETPEEIALSILAQIVAERRRNKDLTPKH